MRQVRRAAEQELFDLANRARSAEVMTVMGRGDGGNTTFFLTKNEVLVGKCPCFIFSEKQDGDFFDLHGIFGKCCFCCLFHLYK